MGLRQALQLLTCLVSSLTVTAVSYQLSDRHYLAQQTQVGLNWARQVASQADVLALNARERSANEEPLGWAVGLLTQGTDPRPMRIFKIDAGSAMSQAETFQLDRATGAFDYSKILMPEKGRGVRVLLQLGYTGFLGARSRLASDALTVGFFVFSYIIVYLLLVWKFGLAGERRLRVLIANWIGQAKVVLNQFGTHIRELIRGEKQLVTNAAECRDLLLGLEEQLEAEGRELQELGKSQNTLASLGIRAETLALSAVIEAARLGPGAKRLVEISEEVHRLVQRQRELGVAGEQASEARSLGLLNCLQNVQNATRLAQEVLGSSQDITGQVRQTTEVVMSQAKLMKELNSQLDRQFAGLRTEHKANSADLSAESGKSQSSSG